MNHKEGDACKEEGGAGWRWSNGRELGDGMDGVDGSDGSDGSVGCAMGREFGDGMPVPNFLRVPSWLNATVGKKNGRMQESIRPQKRQG